MAEGVAAEHSDTVISRAFVDRSGGGWASFPPAPIGPVRLLRGSAICGGVPRQTVAASIPVPAGRVWRALLNPGCFRDRGSPGLPMGEHMC